MRTILILCAFAGSLYAQAARGEYTYEKETSLSSSTEKVTLHLPTGSSRTAKMVGATVYCSAACTITLSRDGTAPANTTAAANKLNGTSAAASVVPYYSSDVGTSTTIKTYTIAAGSEQGIDMPYKGLLAGENITLSTNSITATVRIFFQWREF